jgi:hypothetical protein
MLRVLRISAERTNFLRIVVREDDSPRTRLLLPYRMFFHALAFRTPLAHEHITYLRHDCCCVQLY